MNTEFSGNSIIIEGLWFSGKTTLARYYCSRNGYEFVPEPIHIGEVSETEDIDSWYLAEHLKRETLLNAMRPVVLERSSLSSYAFRYALEKGVLDYSELDRLRESVREHFVLVVYLKSDKLSLPQDISSNEYYTGANQILLDAKRRERYEQWFLEELPYKYGITPFILRTSENGIRKTPERMEEEIRAVLTHNRVAQVNVVCYSGEKTDTRILVLKRNQRKGGFWQTITGGAHVGESLFEAAKREVLEEIGLEANNSSLFATKAKYSFPGNDGYILDEYVFAFRVDNMDSVHISEEHDAFEWLGFEAAKNRVAYENNRTAIDSLKSKTGSLVD